MVIGHKDQEQAIESAKELSDYELKRILRARESKEKRIQVRK